MKFVAFEEYDLRSDAKFVFDKKLTLQFQGTFTVIVGDEVIVTRRFSNIARFPDFFPVVVHWGGEPPVYWPEGYEVSYEGLRAFVEAATAKNAPHTAPHTAEDTPPLVAG